MKEFCNKLMKLNPDMTFGVDYSSIALALFLSENGICENRAYSIIDYAHYLYRFYSDIKKAKDNHYYKIINEIWHYQPIDIYDYSKDVLKYVQDNIGLVYVFNTSFYLSDCPRDVDKYYKVIQNIIQTLLVKYIGAEFRLYDSRIAKDEIQDMNIFNCDSRVFYRALEMMNYCFISDETDLKELCAVELVKKEEFDESNYLVLNKEYGKMFLDGSLIIKKNGYPYIDGQRLYQHLEIDVLRKIRHNLDSI